MSNEIPIMPVETDNAHHRVIRTFVKRAGRTTTGQARALEILAPQFVLNFQNQMFDPMASWGQERAHLPMILEIGFGMGEATAKIAQSLPNINFLCCEVHQPGVGALLKRIEELDLKNIRIFSHDAVEILQQMIADNMLDGIHLFFPDPWHKKRHHKRRFMQAPMVALLCQKLKQGGYFHCATDWEPYAQQSLEVLRAQTQLKNSSTHENGYSDKPSYRPLTKFETRGLRLGHGVWDLIFTKK